MQVVLHGLTTESVKTSRSSGRMNRSAVSSREKLLATKRGQVFPQQCQFRLKSGDGIGIRIREERTKLRVILLGIGPQQQRSPIQRGQKIVGITTNQFQRKPKRSINSGGITPSRYAPVE